MQEKALYICSCGSEMLGTTFLHHLPTDSGRPPKNDYIDPSAPLHLAPADGAVESQMECDPGIESDGSSGKADADWKWEKTGEAGTSAWKRMRMSLLGSEVHR